MINRKEEQGQEAIKKIKDEAGSDAKVEWLPCDMGNLKEVRDVFTGIREREKRLDLVCPQVHIYGPNELLSGCPLLGDSSSYSPLVSTPTSMRRTLTVSTVTSESTGLDNSTPATCSFRYYARLQGYPTPPLRESFSSHPSSIVRRLQSFTSARLMKSTTQRWVI
jgi:hypothetical protein